MRTQLLHPPQEGREWLWCGVENKRWGKEEAEEEEVEDEEEVVTAGNGRRTRRRVKRGKLAER